MTPRPIGSLTRNASRRLSALGIKLTSIGMQIMRRLYRGDTISSRLNVEMNSTHPTYECYYVSDGATVRKSSVESLCRAGIVICEVNSYRISKQGRDWMEAYYARR